MRAGVRVVEDVGLVELFDDELFDDELFEEELFDVVDVVVVVGASSSSFGAGVNKE